MSLPDEIRAVLCSASGPMSNPQIRADLDNGATSEDVGGALHYMTKTGELTKLDGERPSKYVLTKGFVPKRKAAEPTPPHIEIPPPARLAKPQAPKTTRATTAAPKAEAPAVSTCDRENLVHFPRAGLRALVIALLGTHTAPMSPSLRHVVTAALDSTI